MYRRRLARHIRRNHTDHPVFDCNQCDRSFARPDNLEKHKRTCTGGHVPAAKKRRIASEFQLQENRKSLGGVPD